MIKPAIVLACLFLAALQHVLRIVHLQCRVGCGACCIAPSISSPIPGMPNGKPANTRCVQLDENNLCRIFGQPERPKVCDDFTAQEYVCGESREEALILLTGLEQATATTKR